MKVKTIDVVNAYDVLVSVKVAALSDDAALAVWHNLKGFRSIVENYNKSIEVAQKSLQDEEFEKMQDRAQAYNVKLKEYQKEGKEPTDDMKVEVAEINKFFNERNSKAEKYFNELKNTVNDIDVDLVEETEMLKALKSSDKGYAALMTVSWLVK